MAPYGDTQTVPSTPTPSINVVGFMEQSIERLTTLRRILVNANNRLTGNSAPEPINKDQRAPAYCVAALMEDAHRVLNEIEYLAQQIETSVGHSLSETRPASGQGMRA